MKEVCFSRSSITFLFVIFLQYAASQTVPVSHPLSTLDPWIEEKMMEWKVPGLALAIVHKDSVYHIRGYGYSDIDQNKKVDINTLFPIGSCSKAFTATALSHLADQGKLDLDLAVRDYLPDFQLEDDYTSKQITIRDLLSHRTGLPRHDLVWYGSDKSEDEIYNSLKFLPASQELRAGWQYQNLMYMVAGKLVEKVSGQELEEYIHTHLLDPLDIEQFNYSITDLEKMPNIALPYKFANDSLEKISFLDVEAIKAAAGMNTNIKGMAKWVQLQLNGGQFNGKTIISPSVLQETHAPQVDMPESPNEEECFPSYGLGWVITSYREHKRLHHGGNLDGFSADVCLLPEDSLGIVILTNKNTSEITRVIRNTLIDRFLGLEEINWNRKIQGLKKELENENQLSNRYIESTRIAHTEPSHNLSAYMGTFEHPAYGKVVISEIGGRLFFSFRNFGNILEHFHYNVFLTDIGSLGQLQLQFHYNRKGIINKVGIPFQQGVEDIIFKRVPDDHVPDVHDLQPYIGEYEMGSISARVYLKGQFLRLDVDGRPEYKLLPFGKDQFLLENLKGFQIQFKLPEGSKSALALVSIQPNGNFTIPRKASPPSVPSHLSTGR